MTLNNEYVLEDLAYVAGYKYYFMKLVPYSEIELDNPHVWGSPCWLEWKVGYRAAQLEDEGKQWKK